MSYRIAIATLLVVALFAQLCVKINGQACPEAEDSCHGTGGGDLCNDRCKSCGYNRGECGGTLWQVCQCMRNRAELLQARSRDALFRLLAKQLDEACPNDTENCNRQCERDGYSGGRCNGSHCKCH